MLALQKNASVFLYQYKDSANQELHNNNIIVRKFRNYCTILFQRIGVLGIEELGIDESGIRESLN